MRTLADTPWPFRYALACVDEKVVSDGGATLQRLLGADTANVRAHCSMHSAHPNAHVPTRAR